MSETPTAPPSPDLETSSANKSPDEPIACRNDKSTVTCTYLVSIKGNWRTVTILWCRNIMTHTLTISVNSLLSDYINSCKIDLKSWQFWSKKGHKLFEIDGTQIDIYWDMRVVKYTGSPEPYTDYYVALVLHEEVVLLLGDLKKKAYKRTKSRPALIEPVFWMKKEHEFNRKYFTTRARFDIRNRENSIVIESSTTGAKEPEMWITVDKNEVVHIRNLQWNFRGSELILVGDTHIQVFWDVYAWLFSSPGSGHGWFLFKPGNSLLGKDQDQANSNIKSGDSGNIDNPNSQYYSELSDFCVFLIASKLE